MITVYCKQDQTIKCVILEPGEKIPADALWIDVISPSHDAEMAIEKQLDIEIPTREEVWKNQVLNRLYQENNVIYMTAAIITKVDCPYPQTSSVTFILTPQHLLTVRYITPTSFQNFTQRIQRNPKKFNTSAQVLEGLFEEIITRVAHNSEIAVETLDRLSHSIFGEEMMREKNNNPSQLMKEVLNRLGTCADLNSKINESLHSISRCMSFFKQTHNGGPELDNAISILITDVNALTQQTGFLADKITFQLDATLGMINVEQNVIIKIFSVVAAFFLPPTLISSMYGMNFQNMPELQWPHGYELALFLMVVSALTPYMYFRKKGWL